MGPSVILRNPPKLASGISSNFESKIVHYVYKNGRVTAFGWFFYIYDKCLNGGGSVSNKQDYLLCTYHL